MGQGPRGQHSGPVQENTAGTGLPVSSSCGQTQIGGSRRQPAGGHSARSTQARRTPPCRTEEPAAVPSAKLILRARRAEPGALGGWKGHSDSRGNATECCRGWKKGWPFPTDRVTLRAEEGWLSGWGQCVSTGVEVGPAPDDWGHALLLLCGSGYRHFVRRVTEASLKRQTPHCRGGIPLPASREKS